MPSMAELQDALVNADRAGDSAAARQLADAIHAMQSTDEAKPAAVQVGRQINGVPRQLGLTARYGLEGLAQAAQIVTEPIRYGLEKITGMKGKPLGAAASDLADTLGLPSPQGANERVVGDAARLVAGAGGMGATGAAAQRLPGVAGKVGEFFAANPWQQTVSAAGAGLAGGSAREAGANPWVQAGASLAGGVLAPAAASVATGAARSVGRTAKNAVDWVAPGAVQERNVDQTITLLLRQQGIDWSQIPERARQSMRRDVSAALSTGQDLDPAALRRLIDFRMVNATPTRGMLTQDPVQITREQNLAKIGANSSDIGLQQLAGLQSRNTETLLGRLDELGARNAPDSFATGERAIDALQSTVDRNRQGINALYAGARDTAGRSAELDGYAFTRAANAALDEGNVGSFLPADIANKMNGIARGEIPLTVDVAEQLKTSIGNIQRNSADGNVRAALGMVRRAIDNTPLRGSPQVNPGNLPAVPGTVPPSAATLGQESIDAFNAARRANAQWMGEVERTPALQAVIDGAQPDRFVQQFITGQGATVADVQALRRAIGSDARAIQSVKDNITLHLRSAATNGTDDVAKFSPASYNRALNNIGERKLGEFFSPQEIAELRAVGRVGTLMKAQPDGSAVNNSNSAALFFGKGLDLLDSVAGKLPLGMDTTINGVIRGVQQGRALNVPKGLLAAPERIPLGMRVAPAAIYGGLLSTQPVSQP